MFSFIKKHAITSILTAITLLAAILRLKFMTSSYWYDEILTHMTATQSLRNAITHSLSPICYVLPHFALQIADTESMLRLHSYLAGVIAIPLMYFLGKAWHGKTVGLTAALILALSSSHIFFSHDGRYYSVLFLAGLITLWSIRQTANQPKNPAWWILYTISIVIGTLTHPFYIPYLFCVAGAVVVTAFLTQPGKYKYLTILFVTSVIGLLPLLYIYILHKQTYPQSGNLVSITGEIKQSYLLHWNDLYGYYRDLLYLQDPDHSGLMQLMVIGGAITILIKLRLKSIPLILPPILLPLPFFFIAVGHFFATRYFISLLPIALLLIAIFLVEISSYIHTAITRLKASNRLPALALHPHLAKTTLLCLILIYLIPAYFVRFLYSNHYWLSWREYAEKIAPYASAEDVIIHFSRNPLNPERAGIKMPPAHFELQFYLKRALGNGNNYRYPHATILTADTTELDTLIKRYRNSTIWLIHWKFSPVIRLSPEQNQLFQIIERGYNEMLEVRGAPTTNLINNGDFENPSEIPSKLKNSNLILVKSDNPDAPGTCLQLGPCLNETPVTLKLPIPLDPTKTHTASSDTQSTNSENYILSLNLKYQHALGDPETSGSANINITGTNPSGQNFTTNLGSYYWNQDWALHTWSINHSTHPEIFVATNLNIEIQYTATTGKMWVDNIQFEPGTHPTPYVNGTRLPHDQALAILKAEQQ